MWLFFLQRTAPGPEEVCGNGLDDDGDGRIDGDDIDCGDDDSNGAARRAREVRTPPPPR